MFNNIAKVSSEISKSRELVCNFQGFLKHESQVETTQNKAQFSNFYWLY